MPWWSWLRPFLSLAAACVDVASPAFRPLNAPEFHIRLFGAVETLHHGLPARSYPAPTPDKRCAPEKRRLHGQPIVAPHVLARINAVKVQIVIILL
ncbi:hypothetical protein C8K44_104205 [Aminobacter sp. AP02]|nr:hypothetical protein C8K44_104205 [Aminobacter sp. AP02]